MALYILQGVIVGLFQVVWLSLASFGATWKQQGTFSLAFYPFSLKLFWAPLIDVYYIRWLGRRQTWLLPIQVLLGSTLIVISFYLESLLVQLRVTELTIIFLFIIFLTATQDICVDGWALSLFASSNVIWQSTSQMIGQPIGTFIGSQILLTFESANMTNRFIRQPFGIADKPYGLFTLTHFVRFWGMIFLFVTCIVALLFRERPQTSPANESKQAEVKLTLLETYMSIVRLFKKKCFCQATFIIVVSHVAYAATASMTILTLLR